MVGVEATFFFGGSALGTVAGLAVLVWAFGVLDEPAAEVFGAAAVAEPRVFIGGDRDCSQRKTLIAAAEILKLAW